MRRLIVPILVFGLAFGNLGCPTFRAGKLGPSVVQPPLGDSKPSIAVVVRFRVRIAGLGEGDPHPKFAQRYTAVILEAYRASGLFSVVSTEPAGADLVADVEVLESGEIMNQALVPLTLLSLTVIPIKEGRDTSMTTVFRNASGEVFATIQREDSVTHWMGLLLLPVMPFFTPGRVLGGLFEDLTMSTLSVASEDLSSAVAKGQGSSL